MDFEFASARNLLGSMKSVYVSRWLMLTPTEDPNSLFQRNQISEQQKDLKDTGFHNFCLSIRLMFLAFLIPKTLFLWRVFRSKVISETERNAKSRINSSKRNTTNKNVLYPLLCSNLSFFIATFSRSLCFGFLAD